MLKSLVEDNVALLEQSHGLIAALSPELYAVPPAGRRGGPGAHVRHILDHYLALVDGVPTGRVDYEARVRDERLERDPELALATIAGIVERLRALDESAAPRRLHVVSDGHTGESTLPRELLFLLSHTVHHQALLALLLQPRGVEVDECFGVAPSTLRHWGRLAPDAPLRDAIAVPVHAGPDYA